MDYKDILKTMFENMPENVDTREGSVLYTVSAPTAYELAKAYFVMAFIQDSVMPDTATGENLDKLCKMFGVARQNATNAIRKLEVYNTSDELMDVDLNTRFRINDVSMIVTEKISQGTYKAKVEQAGSIGNSYVGDVLPLSNIEDLSHAYMSDVLIMAQDTETDESLRSRFYSHVSQASFAGNIQDYKERTLQIDGVGAVDVIPVWNGAGTVLLIVGNEAGRTASQELIDTVQNYYQPADNPLGGFAPIGHTVSVTTSTDLPINVSVNVKLASGSSLDIVSPKIEEAVKGYIDSLSFSDQYIYIARITSKILDVDGVIDVLSIAINGSGSNLELSKTVESYQVAGEVTCTITGA